MTGTRHTGLGRVAAAGLLVSAAFLTGCAETGRVGQSATFDVSRASAEDIGAALERDGKVTLRGVLFETDSARLSDAGRDATSRLAEAMQANPTMRLAVVGHTDDTGAFRYNLDLSRRRGEAMTTELIRAHGIADDRVAPVGVGPLAPVASNDTPEGRAENRRVEAVLIQ